LELAGIIVKLRVANPDFESTEFYREKLKQLYNHDYEKIEIETCLDLLLGQQQDEIIVYPDDHIQGI